jgi:hypothetical protein
MTDIEKLFAKQEPFLFPETMVKVKGEIPGRAFFPGGKGTYDNSDDLSNKDVMILGQDFDCEKNYLKTLEAGFEDTQKNATWRNLLKFLHDVNIPHNKCFIPIQFLVSEKAIKGQENLRHLKTRNL